MTLYDVLEVLISNVIRSQILASKFVTETLLNLLNTFFKYVWPFSGHQVLKG